MRKLLFCCYGMGIGGIEKCLVTLTNYLDKSKYDITVAIMNPEYELINQLSRDIKLIRFENQFINTTDTMAVIHETNDFNSKFKLFVRYVIYRLAVKCNLSPWKVQKKIDEKYDIAIAYSHTGLVPEYVIDRVKADKKILWYHSLWTDIHKLKSYSKFNYVVAVSEYCKSNFINTFPSLKEKVVVLYNLYDSKNIIEMAENDNGFKLEQEMIILLTVGRLSKEKGYELAIKACDILYRKLGKKFIWYWVGDGPDRLKAAELIKYFKLEDVFVLLGNKTNPYSYMKSCDVYVQPAIQEAYCTTIIEAKILHKPIVSTNFPSVKEQIAHGKDGMLCDLDENSLANMIFEVIENGHLRECLSQNCLMISNYNNVQLKKYDLLLGDEK